MQSDMHETLYTILGDITARIKSALVENDTRALIVLAEEHRDVMEVLKGLGVSQDAGLLERVIHTCDQVHEVVAEMNQRRDELCRQLMMFERKKRVSSAYAGSGLSVMSVI